MQQRMGGPPGGGEVLPRARVRHELGIDQTANDVCESDDGLSDDTTDNQHTLMLPTPDLKNLPDIENMIRVANTSAAGREALTKFVVGAGYIQKLVPLVEMAEDLEDLPDLHRLCNIMKTLILLNDTAVIELVVTDELILGVVGALECMLQPPPSSVKI